MNRRQLLLLSLCSFPLAACVTQAEASGRRLALTPSSAAKIGKRIWQNECGGTISGLTSWNDGEAFPSLGIGHFIWYPSGKRGPFEESFPRLVKFMQQRGAQVPAWLATTPECPWATKVAFKADLNGPKLTELRAFLSETVALQTEFMALRAQEALPKLLSHTSASERSRLEAAYFAVGSSSAGTYALMDYVNFKGEGIKKEESYLGQGWGLLWVLRELPANLPNGAAAAREFAAAAKRVLGRRIANASKLSPPRDEKRWQAGWFNRCDSYAGSF